MDPLSGKPWVTGEVGGTCIDSNDHVITVNRGFQNGLVAPETVIAVPSPPVVEYDGRGNVVNAWPTDPAMQALLPNSIHGCFVDLQDNVYIAGNGDGIVQKWTHDGSAMLLQIGTKGTCDRPGGPGACGNVPQIGDSTTLLNQPADIAVDPTNGDIYIADGYGNHRIVVFNAAGTFLRRWGGVGPAPGQFAAGDGGHPHCVVISGEDLVYTCDRGQDRIQVFDKHPNNPPGCSLAGSTTSCLPVRIIPVIPGTAALGTAGSAWDVDFSSDRREQYMFEVDGGNEVLWIMNHTFGTFIGGFGGPGHQAGNFTFLHTVSADSKGNLYTGETVGGRRVQKFIRKGFVPDNKLEVFNPAAGLGPTVLHYDPVQ
jgi:hypothetical protein